MGELSIEKSQSKKIGLVEDDKVVRLYIETLLRKQVGVEVVNSWESAEAFWNSEKRHDLEIILVDLDLPGQSGIELIERMRNEQPRVICIVLTSSNHPQDVFSAIRGGASGYLTKQSSPEEWLRSLEGVVRDGLTLSPSIARLVANEFFKTDDALLATKGGASSFKKLTEREEDVLNTLAKFGSAKDTARELGLSHETVRVHMKKIYQKLHVNSKAEALASLARIRMGAG